MYYYDRVFSSEEEKYDFVNECDRQFFSKIESAADDIADDKNIRFILLRINVENVHPFFWEMRPRRCSLMLLVRQMMFHTR